MRLEKFFEFRDKDLEPIKSFYLKDNLNPKIWDDFKIDKSIREDLLQIGKDFFESVELNCEVKDIVFCGSLCNYNWSEKYSDYDLHIIIDYKDVDENIELVEKLCDYAKKQWNMQHDITLKGYEVEVAIQDYDALKEAISTGRMGGVFSLMKNKWIKKPEKIEFIPDEETIKKKATSIMDVIDEIESQVDEDKYSSFKEKINSIWKKIKKSRQSGLEEGGEYSTGNLVFKLLRRNGYVSKVMDLKKYAYDKQFESKYFSLFTHDKFTDEECLKLFGIDRNDIKEILLPITDEFSDKLDISINYASSENLKKIEIHFWITPEYMNEIDKAVTINSINYLESSKKYFKIPEKIGDFIEENLNISFFKGFDFSVKTSKRTGFLESRIITFSNKNEVIYLGPVIYSIFLTKESG